MAQDIRWLQRFSNYCKALAKLGQAVDIVSWRLELADEIDELLQEGLIQRFEYTRELVWKVMKDYAEYQGYTDIRGSRDAIRKALQMLIEDKRWMETIDVVVYDVKNKEILSKASLITKDAFETFPAFSPDGKWLYFCTAPAQKMPENYDKVRYNLCRVAFDPDRGEISFPIDTLVHADSLSYTFPRISPDGRFLMYTETAYGQFPIWHPDAEIRMMDLENRTAMDMSALNSPDTDSYHSWSSNSDWVVFSSRRDNGLYTLPYICHIGKDGKPSKPFLLPQEDPDKYDYQLYSYNIPELTKGAVEVSPYEIQQVAEKNKPEQVRFK